MISTQPYKGSRDFYPEQMQIRDWFFEKLCGITESFGFEKIDAPILEPVDIYLLKTSEEIIKQQIYSFEDRGGRQVALRPEMTPTVSRMVAGKIRELPKPIRWYSIPNLWRYERPGKGRLREHWQLNADIFAAPDEFMADAEILQLAVSLLKGFGAKEGDFMLYLNHRSILNQLLINFLNIEEEKHSSIARAMDKKEKVSPPDFEKMLLESGVEKNQIKIIYEYIEGGFDFLSENKAKFGSSEIETIRDLINLSHDLGLGDFIQYNPSIVRGFDYYTGMVFEVFDTDPENRRSIFGGGRYDNLVSHFSKTTCNAVGFGMGDVTFEDFLATHQLIKPCGRKTQIYVAAFSGKEGRENAFQLAARLRKENFYVEMSLGHEKLKKQFHEADQKKIRFVVLQGEDEIKQNLITLKDLNQGEQKQFVFSELITYLKEV